jgi:hypothetical protein
MGGKDTMSERLIKRIPYGIADYEKIVTGNYYYVDKTMYLREIEEAGSYLFFIRPRRFGKSLFLSMMEGYYDVYYKDRFDELFAHTAVHPDPTPEQGAYLVLKFDCSGIAPNIDEIEKSFINNIRSAARSFLRKYDSYLIDDKKIIEKDMEKRSAASDILLNVVNLCRDSHQKLYVMIDEYDNFANTILSTAGKHEYERLTHGEGFFRAFFNVLKAGTSGMEAPISRLFLTGVSPITLDDVTSGFNIGENISIDAPFNRMLGFTEDDLEAMLEYYQQAGQIKDDPNFLKGIMKEWYNHYLFSPDTGISLYNADMVLYFLKEYFKTDSVPKDLIDRNVRMDYEKLRYLVTTDRGGRKKINGNFGKLNEIVERGEIISHIVRGFPAEKLTNPENFLSLLFYFGLLTVKGIEDDEVILKIPNETAKIFYYEYIPLLKQNIPT